MLIDNFHLKFSGDDCLHSLFPLDSTPQILGHQQDAEKADQIKDTDAHQTLLRLKTYYHEKWNDDDDDLMNDRHLKSWIIRRQKKRRRPISSIRDEYRRYISKLDDHGDRRTSNESNSRRILTQEDTVPTFITEICNIFNTTTICGFLAIIFLILFFGAISVREAMEKDKSTGDRICTDA